MSSSRSLRRPMGYTLSSNLSAKESALTRRCCLVCRGIGRWRGHTSPASKQAEQAKQARGQTAIASAKMAYQIYKEIFGGDRFMKLAAQGARDQRLLWASTSTKN